MTTAQLLAVVEVDPADRVVCRAQGCGHSVYKRIHVVNLDGRLMVYGSDCFSKLFGSSPEMAHPVSEQERQVKGLIDEFAAAQSCWGEKPANTHRPYAERGRLEFRS